ncbi:MAG: hypothetical protein ACP5UF_02835 [Hydrogenobaculum sp.]
MLLVEKISLKVKLFSLGLINLILGILYTYSSYEANLTYMEQMSKKRKAISISKPLFKLYIDLESARIYSRSLAGGNTSVRPVLERTVENVDNDLKTATSVNKKYGRTLNTKKDLISKFKF